MSSATHVPAAMVDRFADADSPYAGRPRPSGRAAGEAEGSLIRALDVVLAVVMLAILAPLLAIIAVLVYVTDPGPVLFAHRRLGRDGRTFRCLKFRSMAIDSQERLQHLLATDPLAREEWERDHKLAHDPRVTPFGHVLRRTSLDELPQLVNVLLGEMSLVGPRPITRDEAWRYGRYIHDYFRVQPGITGLWQVSGRSDTTYRRRVALDVAFARNVSAALYVSILTKTVPAVLLARGSR